VLRRCVETEPKYGEVWTRVSKAVENAHLSTEAMLKKTVVALDKDKEGPGPAPGTAPAKGSTRRGCRACCSVMGSRWGGARQQSQARWKLMIRSMPGCSLLGAWWQFWQAKS